MRGTVWVVLAVGAAGACGDNLAGPDPPALDAQPARGYDAQADAPRGRVFLDLDGDGLFSLGDEPAAGAAVFFEDAFFTLTDAFGHYSIPKQPDDGVVWVRADDTWQPGPHWALAPGGETIAIDFAIPVQPATGPFSFVVASDTHAGIDLMSPQDQITALSQAVDLVDVPYFVTVTGDLTQANHPEHFAWLGQAIGAIDVPFVPVPGNHDWYDGGDTYRMVFGPPTYSFDSGGYRFVVLNDASPLEDRLAFLDMDLALGGQNRTVVALMHRPPNELLAAGLAARGVDIALTGHLHANRVIHHNGFVEYNHQPLAMGGIDTTPAGYRIYRSTGDGQLEIFDRSTVDSDIAMALGSDGGQTFTVCDARLLASVQTTSETVSVTATIDGVGTVAMAPAGGWAWSTESLALCAPGYYGATVHIARADGTTLDVPTSLEVGVASEAPVAADWLAFGGSPEHRSQGLWTGAFPDTVRWTREVGGTVHGGSPVVQSDRLFVAVTDLADGSRGGVVALDARSGQPLWEHRVDTSVPHAPAAAGDRVVFVSQDGAVRCLDAASGALLWHYELAPSAPPAQRSLYSTPTIVGDTVYTGGSHEFAALDLATGDVRWSVESDVTGIWASRASPAIANGVVLLPLNRKDGMVAYDAELGTLLWSTPANTTVGTQASPVIDGDTLYVVNEEMRVRALDVATGQLRWETAADPDGFYWSYLATATPALGDGQLYVASASGRLKALDLATGEVQWTYLADMSLLRATHYHGPMPALSGSPTWTPGRLWVPGSDGTIQVLDTADGQPLWSLDVGVPITSSVVLAGQVAFVAGFDGIVRALSPGP